MATVLAAVVPSPARVTARAGLVSYALTLGGVAARSGAGWRTAAVLSAMHFTWAAGLVSGIAEIAAKRVTRPAPIT
jgi:hypothetical protein